MPKQAWKVGLALILLLSLLANYSIAANQSAQSSAPTASESENKSVSTESLPVLPNPDSSTSAVVEAEAEALSPTYVSASPTSNVLDVETQLNEENNSTVSSADAPSLETKEEENLIQELASSPSVTDTPALESNQGDQTTSTSPSLSPDKDMDNNILSQENASLPPSIETNQSEDVFQENTSLPPSPGLEDTISPAPAPSYSEDSTSALDISDGGSFTQENDQSPTANVNVAPAPAPETKGEADFTTQDYPSSATSPNPESQNPQLNDYSSQLPDPTIQITPSPNDDTTAWGFAPSSHNTILPFNYRAEDEPVEPYEEEEDSWSGLNGAVGGVLVGACVVGLAGFVYQKKKNDNLRAQYTCLAKKGGV